MELWQTNTLELLELARKNTPAIFPERVYSMEEILGELLREKREQSIAEADEYREFLRTVPMRILSNQQKAHGAGCLLYEGVLEKLAVNYDSSYYILPSSIHEVILLPDNGQESVEHLKNMIHEVNSTQVAPEEVLSDSLYYYDFDRKKLRILS